MSEGNRFWRVALGPHPDVPPEKFRFVHDEYHVPANYVTHREIGVIPGCRPAVDILVEMTDKEVHDITMSDPYWKVWDDYRHGVIGWNEWLNHPIHKRPQRSFIKNPASAIKQNYYLS